MSGLPRAPRLPSLTFLSAFALTVTVCSAEPLAPDQAGLLAAEITAIEEALLQLQPTLAGLEQEFAVDGIPALRSAFVPAAVLREPTIPLGPATTAEQVLELAVAVESWDGDGWPSTTRAKGSPEPLAWLDALLPERLELLGIKTIDGEKVEGGTFRSQHELSFRGLDREGRLGKISFDVAIDWYAEGGEFRIGRWWVGEVRRISAQGRTPLMEEVLRDAIPDDRLFKKLSHAPHERFLHAVYTSPLDIGAALPLGAFPLDRSKHITFEATEQHPSLSVVDIDGDGWDDLYVMRRWGANTLLINQRDGTFVEADGSNGLSITNYCTCAIFADFDNDGDEDVFIGRSLERSMLLENKAGRFTDISHQIHDARLPFLVTSATAADYDGDGLLDLYIGTYFGANSDRKPGWVEEFIEEADRPEYERRAAEMGSHHYDFTGPPNLLLKNQDGMRFTRAPEDNEVRSWRSTFQPSWSDWDNDGDPDLLVTNDYGPDQMLRNDSAEGGGRHFVEIAPEVAPDVTSNIFGMGASWEDVNGDTIPDLYLSAMFSKAGTRITRRLEGLGPRAKKAVMGSLLLTSGESGTSWNLASGSGEGLQPVDKVGWSWGGQFFDPDNDGDFDLYAPTGYFTPPPEFSSEVDF